MHRGLRLIVGTMYFTAFSLLHLEFHRWLEAIHIHAQGPVEFGQLSVREFSRETIIANHLPDNLSILLLHVALIGASSGTSPGEGDLCLLTKSQQFQVNKLSSVIGVEPQDGKRKQRLRSLECSYYG